MPACLATAFNSELAQNGIQWANSGKAALKQVKTNECGEEQEVFAYKYRACLQT
jgi:hypothetical protein